MAPDPTPQREHCIMEMTITQGREARDRIGEGGAEVKTRKKPEKSYRRDVKNGGRLRDMRQKNVDKRMLVQ